MYEAFEVQISRQAHDESIQELICKLTELEKDKSLWDEAARIRKAREQSEGKAGAQWTQEVPATPATWTEVQPGQEVNMYQEEEDITDLEEYLYESRKRQDAKWSHMGKWTDDHAF